MPSSMKTTEIRPPHTKEPFSIDTACFCKIFMKAREAWTTLERLVLLMFLTCADTFFSLHPKAKLVWEQPLSSFCEKLLSELDSRHSVVLERPQWGHLSVLNYGQNLAHWIGREKNEQAHLCLVLYFGQSINVNNVNNNKISMERRNMMTGTWLYLDWLQREATWPLSVSDFFTSISCGWAGEPWLCLQRQSSSGHVDVTQRLLFVERLHHRHHISILPRLLWLNPKASTKPLAHEPNSAISMGMWSTCKLSSTGRGRHSAKKWKICSSPI